MRNIRKFETFADFLASQRAYSGTGEYVLDQVPGFVYIKELYDQGKYAVYNDDGSGPTPGKGYVFGDLIYYDGNELKSVYWSGFTGQEMGMPVGLVVVPTNMAGDGNARILSFENFQNQAQTEDPGVVVAKGAEFKKDGETKNSEILGAIHYGDAFYFESIDDMPQGLGTFDGFSATRGGSIHIDPDPQPKGTETRDGDYIYDINVVEDGYSMGMMSSDASFDGNQNPVADGEYYPNILGSINVVSPYLTASNLPNTAYTQEVWEVETGGGARSLMTYYNALSDMKGLSNTRLLASIGEEAYEAAQDYETSGTQAGDWYVPSAGEWGYVVARAWAIQYIMSDIYDRMTESAGGGGSEPTRGLPSFDLPNSAFTSTLCTGSYGDAPLMVMWSEPDAGGGTIKGELKSAYPSDIPAPLLLNPQYYALGYTWQGDNPKESETRGSQVYSVAGFVRPMAMINNGSIVRTQEPGGGKEPVGPITEEGGGIAK